MHAGQPEHESRESEAAAGARLTLPGELRFEPRGDELAHEERP